jgi:uncharacterized delta-60 repeat protein
VPDARPCADILVTMHALRRGSAALVAGALAALACGELDPFQCVGDAQCRRGDADGTCTSVGYCAYPDDVCPSGMRYSPDAAPAIAGECTEPELPAPDDSGSSGEVPMSSTTGSSDGEPGEEGSSSTGPAPFCGDAETQEDEECDDGNATRGDGCNPDCRHSGVLVSSFTSERAGSDVAWDMILWEGDIVIVGQAEVEGESIDLLAARYDAAGAEVWSQTWSGSAHVADRMYAVARSPGGALLAAGYVVPSATTVTPRPQFWIGELDPETGLSVWDDRDGEPPPANDQVWDLLAPEDGTVVVTGRIGTAAAADFVVTSYATAGNALALEWSEAFSGAADTSDWGYALTLDAEGRIVAGGATHATTVDIDRWLEVFMPDGTVPAAPCRDDGAGSDGRVPEGDDQIRGLALHPDGRIAATGFATKSRADGRDAWVGLYDLASCQLDWQRTVPGAAHDDDQGRAVAVDDDGTIVTVGFLRDANTDDLWVAKWNDSGDKLWQAELVNGPGDGTDIATSVAIDEDGEIVVAGYVGKPGGADAWIGRYTP